MDYSCQVQDLPVTFTVHYSPPAIYIFSTGSSIKYVTLVKHQIFYLNEPTPLCDVTVSGGYFYSTLLPSVYPLTYKCDHKKVFPLSGRLLCIAFPCVFVLTIFFVRDVTFFGLYPQTPHISASRSVTLLVSPPLQPLRDVIYVWPLPSMQALYY